jgi:hypothetical protein
MSPAPARWCRNGIGFVSSSTDRASSLSVRRRRAARPGPKITAWYHISGGAPACKFVEGAEARPAEEGRGSPPEVVR